MPKASDIGINMKWKGRAKSKNIQDRRPRRYSDEISDIIWKDNVKSHIEDSLEAARSNKKPTTSFKKNRK
jgi:hypothetical protein